MDTSVRRRVYVISDLHLGGAADPANREGRGFRIFTQTAALVSFLDGLAGRPPDGPRTELVINGDFVDFLAEPDPDTGAWTALKSAPQAESLLGRIAGPDREGPVFDALGRFLGRGHRLTLLLGNHDVELSFPAVRRALERRLGADGRRDLTFLYDGEAYVIGDVLIEHGNRYDEFNTNDYDALRRARSLQSRRVQAPQEPGPRASPGSELVASTINPLKQDYPFLDLLKPENEAVPPVLLALHPAARKALLRVAALAWRARGHRMRSALLPRHEGDIGASPDAAGGGARDLGALPPEGAAPDALERLLAGQLGPAGLAAFRRALEESGGGPGDEFGGDVSAGAWALAERGVGLLRLLTDYPSRQFRRRLPALLQALRVLQGARTFDRDQEPAGPYRDAATALAGNGFRLVLFGHTHVARDVQAGAGRYFNTGTWADRLRFPAEILDGPEEAALGRLEAFLTPLRDRRSFEAALARGDLGARLDFEPVYARLDFAAGDRLAGAGLRTFDATGEV
jgi:UDP-2,3-diacylglucosamine pyrophosphatase LpxH